MQVGNIYLDIKVKGSDAEGIITYDMLESFEIVETAGTSLPYICFSFATMDEKLANLFMQNNEVMVTIGETREKADTFKLHSIDNPKDTDPSSNSWRVQYGGFLGSNEFMVNKGFCADYPGNSLMVAKKIVEDYAGGTKKVITDIEKTNENQVLWRQIYSTPSMFLVDTLLHMDIQPSFPLFTFDKYGNFCIRDFNKLREQEPQWVFTPLPVSASQSNEIQYLNNFNVDNFKSSYNLYSGYNKSTEIYDTSKGIPDYVIEDNIPILASTKESEGYNSGNRISLNKIQSDNVHNTYMESFAHNTNCLMSLSSILGCVRLFGYYKKLKPTDIVYVKVPDRKTSDKTLEGKYLIDTIVTTIETSGGNAKSINTFVYVTRDNRNNIEDFITEKKERMKITKKLMRNLANAVSQARIALAAAAQLFDGTFTRACMSYVTASKVNLLRMFSVSANMMDFTSQARFLQSLLIQGNTLMNILMNMIFPSSIALMLRDFLLEKPTKRALASKYIEENVPFEIQGLISDVVDALMGVHDSLNSIAEDNNITAREIPVAPTDNSEFNETENKLNEIFTEFENNTTGLDIPFPIVELTEEQKLYPINNLKDLVATETIANLTDLGYMDDVDTEKFKEILLGKTPIDFEIINQINRNAGDKYNYRYWGTYGATNEALYAWAVEDNVIYTKGAELSVYSRLFNADASPYMGDNFRLEEENEKYFITYTDIEGTTTVAERAEDEDINSDALVQLTEFYITKGYKDKYRTIPCTKLISATKNARLYFACPQSEENLKFYVNSKRVLLKSFPIDLGIRTATGVKVMYNVYYTETGYNSNSTMLEVRQG
jgi:hypothetical protein